MLRVGSPCDERQRKTLDKPLKRQKIINIALCFLMIFVCLGFCSANKGLYLAAICEALGVKRTVFSLSTSCRYITTSFVNVFFGMLVAKFGTSPDFYEVTDGTVNCLQLGDCLLVNRADGTVGGHIRVVTGIGRDEQGLVRMVEVSEGVTHAARARWYPAEEFARTLLTGGSDRVFRYRYLDSVSPVEPMISHAGGQLMLNYGDYSNYLEGEMASWLCVLPLP